MRCKIGGIMNTLTSAIMFGRSDVHVPHGQDLVNRIELTESRRIGR